MHLYIDNQKQLARSLDREAGATVEGLPVYRRNEVSGHADKSSRIWVSFKNGVYDITDFIEKHPGGTKIMMAAGGSLEPFWHLYAVHKSPQILEMLEQYRIGEYI
jgi:sulfite oxidase